VPIRDRPHQEILVSLAAVMLVISVLTTAVLAANKAATLQGDVEVVDIECNEYGHVNEISLQIKNQSNKTEEVTPHVWSSKHHVQYAWSPENITLKSGTQTVTITAPNRDAGPDPGERAQWWLADGQQRLVVNWKVPQCVMESIK